MNFIQQLEGKKCLVLGAGVTGRAVQKALLNFGAKSVVFDEKPSNDDAVVNHVPEKIELAIVSPGWRLDHPVIKQLEINKVQIISEIDFAWEVKNVLAPTQKWIALTGTNGKTTTIQMIESIFNQSGIKGRTCGNVGISVIEAVCTSEKMDFLAIELSSFQIEWSNLARFEAIALLNISEDHIDWHGSYEKYVQAKLKLVKLAKIVIANKSDHELSIRLKNSQVIWYSLTTPAPGELGLVEEILVDRAFGGSPDKAHEIATLADINPPAPHNVSNALAAAALMLTIGSDYAGIKKGLLSFIPDHHRMELVLEKDEIKWIDDSKATNADAAAASLLSNFNVIWIAGGLAKGANMDSLLAKCIDRIKIAILIGTDRGSIETAINKYSKSIKIEKIDKKTDSISFMNEIVKYAKSVAQPGDTVLLAPACASMDQFRSYAERGELFAAAVKRYA